MGKRQAFGSAAIRLPCRRNGDRRAGTAEPVPPALIDGGLAAPGLFAWVLTRKYLDHLPLYRIEQMCTRFGAPIARSTRASWVGTLGVRLQPRVDLMAQRLREGPVLHADETPVQQLDPEPVKRSERISGRTEATIWKTVRRWSSLIIAAAEVASMSAISCRTGVAI